MNKAADLMPKSEEDQQILEQRAQHYIYSKENVVLDNSEACKYICFTLGPANERYGIPYCYIIEVLSSAQITKVPNVKAHIYGIINRQGALITIVDLKQFFATQISAYKEEASIIVIKALHMTIGIMTDNIIGGDVYETEQLDPPLTVRNTIKPELILGLHQGITAIINIESLVMSDDLQIRK